MSLTQSFAPSRLEQPAGSSLKRFLSRFIEARRARAGRQRTAALLESLDERTLKDIGLCRAEIGSVVAETTRDRVRRYDPRWYRHGPA